MKYTEQTWAYQSNFIPMLSRMRFNVREEKNRRVFKWIKEVQTSSLGQRPPCSGKHLANSGWAVTIFFWMSDSVIILTHIRL